MKLKFLIRAIKFHHPGREHFRSDFSAVVNTRMIQFKDNLYMSGATPKNGCLNISEGWQFYNLRKL